MFKFNKKYFLLTLIFFVIEVLIGLYVKDKFVRPYGGDFLVVILLYFFLKSFLNISSKTIAILVLLFSFCVEFLQKIGIVNILGLEGNKLAEIVIGTGFSWWDILAYILGIITVYYFDTSIFKTRD